MACKYLFCAVCKICVLQKQKHYFCFCFTQQSFLLVLPRLAVCDAALVSNVPWGEPLGSTVVVVRVVRVVVVVVVVVVGEVEVEVEVEVVVVVVVKRIWRRKRS